MRLRMRRADKMPTGAGGTNQKTNASDSMGEIVCLGKVCGMRLLDQYAGLLREFKRSGCSQQRSRHRVPASSARQLRGRFQARGGFDMQGAGREGDFRAVGQDNVRDFQQYILFDLMEVHPLDGFGEGVDEKIQ